MSQAQAQAQSQSQTGHATKPATVPLPAATILLLRDSAAAGLEVFMVLRHQQIDFASGALVFPGGKVDPQDADIQVQARVAPYPGATPEQSRLRSAAIREAFEESGILLARQADGVPPSAGRALDELRQRLNAHSLSWPDLLAGTGLQLASDALLHYGHWITPPMMAKRFDTHFYLARVPADQVAGHDGGENVDSLWISPQQVLLDAAAGRRTVIFPTLSNIVRLAQYHSVDEAFAATAATPVLPIEPWTEQRADGRYLCIRTDAGYSLSEQKFGPDGKPA